jgi:Family of unknown function (DUF5719)
MERRLPALVLSLVAAASIVAVGAGSPAPITPAFGTVGADWMPAAPEPSGLTGSWFCPGVPATGEEGVGGEVVVANPRDVAMSATVSLLGGEGQEVVQELTVEPRARAVVDVDAALTAPFVSAVVEIDGGGGVVEQRAIDPAGEAVAPCANSTASTWYLAEGFTVDGSSNQLVLTNPYRDAAIVDIGFATLAGSRSPPAFQGFPVPARSVQVIDLAEAGARSEQLLAVRVEAVRGRVVVGRAQHFLGGGRAGFTMSLASPALRDQWWFADGEKAATVSERFSLYNPTDDDVEVDVIFLGIEDDPQVDPILVPARQVVEFDPGDVATLAEGPHAVVFGTGGVPSIVVERAVTRPVDGGVSTSVLLGAPPRPDGYVATTWTVAIGPSVPTTGALVLFNVDNTPGTITVEAVGESGPEPVPGLEAVPIGAASRLAIDLGDAALGRQLIVTSTTRVFVERSMPSGDGRSASWAVPAT